MKLNEIMNVIMKSTSSLPKDCFETLKSEIENYNEQSQKAKTIPIWNSEYSCVKVLNCNGDIKKGRIARQLTQRFYVDLLSDFVTEEQQKVSPDHSLPLLHMLNLLHFGSTKRCIEQCGGKKKSPYTSVCLLHRLQPKKIKKSGKMQKMQNMVTLGRISIFSRYSS